MQLQRPLRFGEFKLDVNTCELRNNGRKLDLQGQPFQILAALLEQPGQLINRAELKRRLWPSDTFVDFDHSLNRAVNRLREALEDSAEHPRFIETLPRRGYRFIAVVEEEQSQDCETQTGVELGILSRARGFSRVTKCDLDLEAKFQQDCSW